MNAKLRAMVYDACRQRGLTPDGKADVKAAAEQGGAMQEGRVVADALALVPDAQGLARWPLDPPAARSARPGRGLRRDPDRLEAHAGAGA